MCYYYCGSIFYNNIFQIKKKSQSKAKKFQQSILDKKMEVLMSAPTLVLQPQAVPPENVDVNKIRDARDMTIDSINKQNYIDLKLEMEQTKAKFKNLQIEYSILLREYNKNNEKLESLQKLNAKEMDKTKLEFKNLKIKHENLLKKCNEKSERVKSLHILNEKLQSMLFELKSDKNGIKII